MVVMGERKMEKEYKEADYYRVERFYGTFERHFPIPKTIDEKAVTASSKEGVLEIVLRGAVLVAEATKLQAKAIP
jgi:HSP20 family protein